MEYTTTISVAEMAKHLNDPDWAVVDCRFKLAEPDQGRKDYESAHIPGAVYAHLNHDLSGAVIKGVTGRHPLPGVEKISQVLSNFGIDSQVQVVAYDDQGGAMAAVRVWWLLRWLGHEKVAVLDGGWQEWLRHNLPVRSGVETRPERSFSPHLRNELIVTTEEVEAIREDPDYRLVDARSADRFRGENETIDPIPGHIPGAVSAPYAGNLKADGTFQPENELAERYRKLSGDLPSDRLVFYCGSGITSVHNILAMKKAGLGEARLYPGSYSEWIADPQRPVETKAGRIY